MARFLFFLIFSIFLLTMTTTTSTSAKFIESDEKLLAMKQEKVSHLRFYLHDILSGRNPTSVPIARGPTTNTSSTFFGQVNVIDDPLTVGPDMSSKLVGRAQGLYAMASQETVGLMMAMNFMFTKGKYNGSTVTVMGNEVLTGVREMPVVGGSGLFRFARGYVQARTHKADLSTGDAVVKYDCYVVHY